MDEAAVLVRRTSAEAPRFRVLLVDARSEGGVTGGQKIGGRWGQ